jgi:hypothetical protein
MLRRNFGRLAVASAAALVTAMVPALAGEMGADGIVKAKSGYGMDETIDRIKKDIAAKGIKLFDVIDQAKLAKDAGIDIKPSTLIIFGNPWVKSGRPIRISNGSPTVMASPIAKPSS